jgi:hypothetical protein
MDSSSAECDSAVSRLNELCVSVKGVELRDEPVEQMYVGLLEFLQQQQACRQQLEAELQVMVAEFRHARERPPRLSIDAIAFCMRTLRWSGVLLAAQLEHQEFFVPRRDDFMWRLMDAYAPDWSGGGEYAYYTGCSRGAADA